MPKSHGAARTPGANAAEVSDALDNKAVEDDLEDTFLAGIGGVSFLATTLASAVLTFDWYLGPYGPLPLLLSPLLDLIQGLGTDHVVQDLGLRNSGVAASQEQVRQFYDDTVGSVVAFSTSVLTFLGVLATIVFLFLDRRLDTTRSHSHRLSNGIKVTVAGYALREDGWFALVQQGGDTRPTWVELHLIEPGRLRTRRTLALWRNALLGSSLGVAFGVVLISVIIPSAALLYWLLNDGGTAELWPDSALTTAHLTRADVRSVEQEAVDAAAVGIVAYLVGLLALATLVLQGVLAIRRRAPALGRAVVQEEDLGLVRVYRIGAVRGARRRTVWQCRVSPEGSSGVSWAHAFGRRVWVPAAWVKPVPEPGTGANTRDPFRAVGRHVAARLKPPTEG